MRSLGLTIRCGVLVAVLALVGCGGSDDEPLTKAGVMQCIRDGGGQLWPLLPREPLGAPPHPEHVYMIGPDRGHIAVFLSLRPASAKALERGFDDIGEYDAYTARSGEVVILLDQRVSKADRTLAYDCIAAA